MHGSSTKLPISTYAYFQEYDPNALDLTRDANLIIQRVLEFGTWEEIRWLFGAYSRRRVQLFLREHGERWLKPVTFNYWRKLLGIRRWTPAPFPKGEVWRT